MALDIFVVLIPGIIIGIIFGIVGIFLTHFIQIGQNRIINYQ